VKGGLDSWSEFARFQKLEILDQVVVILGLNSLFELGEFLVNHLDHLAGELNFKFLVEVRDVLPQYFFKTNQFFTVGILSLQIQVGDKSSLSPLFLLREQAIFQITVGRNSFQGLIVRLKNLFKSAI
jgi:hypothetical protein